MLYQYRSAFSIQRTTRLLIAAVVTFASINCSVAQQQVRTWTSSTGKQVEATFKEFREGSVYLTDDKGKDGKFSPSQFSEPDQKYVRDLNLYHKNKEKWDKDPKKDPIKKPEPVMPKDPRGTPPVPGQPGEATPPPVSTDDPLTTPLMAFTKRNWKDVKGRAIDGRLFNAKDDKVYIQNSEPEKVIAVAIKNLEKKDQDYVSTQLKGLGRTDLLTGLGLVEAVVAKQDPTAPPGANPAPGVAAAPPAGSPARMPPGGLPPGIVINIEMPANIIPPNTSVNSVLQSIIDGLKQMQK